MGLTSLLLSALSLSVLWTLLGASRMALPTLPTRVLVSILLLPLEVVGVLLVMGVALLALGRTVVLLGVVTGLLVVSVLALARKRGKEPLPLTLEVLLVTGLVGIVFGRIVGLVMGVVSLVGVVVAPLVPAAGVVGASVVVRLREEVSLLGRASLVPVLSWLSPRLNPGRAISFLARRVVGLIARFVGRDVSRKAAFVLLTATVVVTIRYVIVRLTSWLALPPSDPPKDAGPTLSVSFLSRIG